MIHRIIGRSSDIVVNRNNNRLHESFFCFLFRNDPAVTKYQAVYNEHRNTVNLQTDGSKTVAAYQAYLQKLQEQVCFEEYQLLVDLPFILLRNGKHKQIVDSRTCGVTVEERL